MAEGSDGLLKVGGKFGDYDVLKRLGKGGMGEVYLLRSPSDGEFYAAKIMSPPKESDAHEWRRRFANEAAVAMKVHHDNLIQIYDVGEDPDTGLCYMIMEYLDGGSLSDRIKKKGRLPVRDAVDITMKVALALEASHRAGIIHRDIKPDNIMFTAEGVPKLVDLGVARFADEGKTMVTMTGVIIGTPAYMAPEQMMDSHGVDARADVYSLGVVLYEMLAGARPNEGSTAMELLTKAVKGEELPDIREMRPEVSATIGYVLSRMTAPKPDNRPSSALEAAKLLRDAFTGELKPPLVRKRPSAVKRRRSGGVATVVGAAFLVAVAAAVFHILGNSPANDAGRPTAAAENAVVTNIVERVKVVTNVVSQARAKDESAKPLPTVTPATTEAWRPGPTPAWFVEWDKALAEARKTNRALFVLNTGSDWCHWCKKLKEDVLDKPGFQDFSARNLVLLYLDSPSRNPLGKAQKTHNKEIVKTLGFGGGVPSVEMFTADGRRLGKIGGGGLALDPYIDKIKSILAENGEPVHGDDVKLLFCEGYGSLSAKLAAERAKLPPVAKEDFKARLTGVAACDRKFRKFDTLEFHPPTTRLEVPAGKMAVFRVEYDFPNGYAAAIWTRGKGSLFYNPSGRFPGKGVAYGFLGTADAEQELSLDSIDIRTNSEPELDDCPKGWTICAPKVDLHFLKKTDSPAEEGKGETEKNDAARREDKAVEKQQKSAAKKSAAKTVVLFPRLDRDLKAWAYSFDEANGWTRPDFDDSRWKRSAGGFGSRDIQTQIRAAVINTHWDSRRIFLRRHFSWSGNSADITRVVADLFIDDFVKIYLNGRLVNTIKESNENWVPHELPVDRVAQALKTGDNVLCAEVEDFGHCQYFDCGILVECSGVRTAYQGPDEVREVRTPAGTWTVRVSNGIAQIGNGEHVALNPRPKGRIEIPTELDGLRITKIAEKSFLDCAELKEVKVPEGIKSIGCLAFAGCRSLRSVSLPESLEFIASEAFNDSRIARLDIKNVRIIASSLCRYCNELEEVRVSSDNPTYFVKDGILYDRVLHAVVFCPRSRTRYTFPKGIQVIYNNAFQCTKLKSIVIPETVAYVGHCAFNGCQELERVEFKGADARIDGWSFGNTPKLAKVVLPHHLKELDDWSIFENAASLESIEIPDTVEIIGDAVFANCRNLKKVSLGKSLRIVRHRVFAGCDRLESISFPDKLEELGDGVLSRCPSLKAVRFMGDKPRIGNDLYKESNPSLVTLVNKGADGWSDAGNLPEHWPADAGGDSRKIRYR